MTQRAFFEVWDNRECVSRHSTVADADRSIRVERDPRTFTLYDTTGRVVAMYRDGRELAGDLDGSAF